MAKRERLGRITDTSLAERAKVLIREAIFEGRILPEERLTIERIADELGISRTPVREALKALESDGVVRLFPRRGAMVTAYTRDEIYDRYSISAGIEGFAGALACERQGPGLADLLRRDCDELAGLIAKTPLGTASVGPLIEANRVFHDRIMQASGSATSLRVLESLRMPLAYRVFHWQAQKNRDWSLQAHRQIAEAFAQRDPGEVRRLMEVHQLEARDYLIALHKESTAKAPQ